MNGTLRALTAYGLMFLPAAACALRGFMVADIPAIMMAQAMGLVLTMLCLAIVLEGMRIALFRPAGLQHLIVFGLCVFNLPNFTAMLGYTALQKPAIVLRSGEVGYLFSAAMIPALCIMMGFTVWTTLHRALSVK